jgi:two-component system, OmpR family, sensor histidine kinase ChvG
MVWVIASVNRLRRYWRRFSIIAFSSLLRRIVMVNLMGLMVLVGGIFFLTQFREGLVDSRVRSLFVQGEIIAGAIAQQATGEVEGGVFDPKNFIDVAPGSGFSPFEDTSHILEFPINPVQTAALFRRLITPTQTRAKVYERDGDFVVDSNGLNPFIIRQELPVKEPTSWLRFFRTGDFPSFIEHGQANGKAYPEVEQALRGNKASSVRMNDKGELIVSVAVPIQRFRGIAGALMLSTPGGDIDARLTAERMNILKTTLVAAGVMVLLSLMLAQGIAGPMRRLSAAADRVKGHIKSREIIPDFTNRPDEIGRLSGSLREMTSALYNRIEATERFAADVAHEIKNPLTSLRSAVETLPLAKTKESQKRLLDIIQHDVKRLDRLITDISQASRLDAELARRDSEPVHLKMLLETLVEIANGLKSDVRVRLQCDKGNYIIPGHDSRLGQVFSNLIDNARSFSPAGAEVTVFLSHNGDETSVIVEDCGMGIRPDALERVFERFYTDRPQSGFGQNSGLGLAIAKQIIEGHGGQIHAENKVVGTGARFIVSLPS